MTATQQHICRYIRATREVLLRVDPELANDVTGVAVWSTASMLGMEGKLGDIYFEILALTEQVISQSRAAQN